MNQPQCRTEEVCLPIRHLCDGNPFPIFSAGTSPSYNGSVTVTNTSISCNMIITITDVTGTNSHTINPDSSFSTVLNQVTLVTGQCSCIGNSCNNKYCIGVFEGTFNLQGGC